MSRNLAKVERSDRFEDVARVLDCCHNRIFSSAVPVSRKLSEALDGTATKV
jgi:hypothetical protein